MALVKKCQQVRATPKEELSMLCILYLAILEEKRESNRYCIWFAKIVSHLFPEFSHSKYSLHIPLAI